MEEINNLKQNKKEDKKDKKNKGIWGNLFSKNIVKKNKVAILYLQNNGIAKAMELEAKKGFFTINGRTYHEDRDCIYRFSKENIPLAIIPEWSLIPYGTKKWHDKEMIEKFSELEDHVLRGIRHAEFVRLGGEGDKKINMKNAVLIGIVVIIGLAIATGYA